MGRLRATTVRQEFSIAGEEMSSSLVPQRYQVRSLNRRASRGDVVRAERDMGYYVRILTPSTRVAPISVLRGRLREAGLAARVVCTGGPGTAWTELMLLGADAQPSAQITRDRVLPDSLGAEEIAELLDELDGARPARAAAWLREYLHRVKVVYCLQVFSSPEDEAGWSAMDAVRTAIWQVVGGISQADAEGFSNEDGDHIVWQFPDQVSGLCRAAVLREETWVSFEMDLGNADHRAAFLRGEVPDRVASAS